MLQANDPGNVRPNTLTVHVETLECARLGGELGHLDLNPAVVVAGKWGWGAFPIAVVPMKD